MRTAAARQITVAGADGLDVEVPIASPAGLAEAMRRLEHTLRLADAILAAAMVALGAAPKRRTVDEALGRPPAATPRAVSTPALDLMRSRKQIPERAWYAGRHVDGLLSRLASLDGLGSTLKNEGMLGGGSAQAEQGVQVTRLEVAGRWARLQQAILDDARCGATPAQRHDCIRVVELVAHHGYAVTELEKWAGLGNRKTVARRLAAGLAAIADELQIRDPPEGRIRVTHAVEVAAGD